MGGCTSRDNFALESFDAKESEQLKLIFADISGYDPNTQARKIIGERGLKKHFKENEAIAHKLYHFMQRHSPDEIVNYKAMAVTAEVLIKEPEKYFLETFNLRKFDKFELFCLISLKRYTLPMKDEMQTIYVSYVQGLNIMKEVLYFASRDKTRAADGNDLGARVAVNPIFGSDVPKIDLLTFSRQIQSQLVYINDMVKLYFSKKLLDSTIRMKLPMLERPSYILNNDLLALLYYSTKSIQSCTKMHHIYSGAKGDFNFNRLAYTLRFYPAPTLILVKHVEKYDDEQKDDAKISHIFGGVANTAFKDKPEYSGDSDCYVFSLVPKFRNYFTSKGEGGTSFLYLNSRKETTQFNERIGLGFGGKNFDSFRLWFDEDIENGSYTSPDDNTYEKGFLVEPYVQKLDIQGIEIWGLGDDSALRRQTQDREESGHLFNESLNQSRFNRNGSIREPHRGMNSVGLREMTSPFLEEATRSIPLTSNTNERPDGLLSVDMDKMLRNTHLYVDLHKRDSKQGQSGKNSETGPDPRQFPLKNSNSKN
eukprot:TRINITY_DN2496_c0_g1_i3.p1 TRINITY_DN2496_c0_g1~~TRINITY_DN2496_c0_g1_i3.p1  ORF type:complete len:537 (-),score=64.89 TRINITY_DN2496_c0_g1_i3:222-1832(-)